MRHAECSETCRLTGGKCSPEANKVELAQVRSLTRLTAEVREHSQDAAGDLSAQTGRGEFRLTEILSAGLTSERVPADRHVPDGPGRAADCGGEQGRAARSAGGPDDCAARARPAHSRWP